MNRKLQNLKMLAANIDSEQMVVTSEAKIEDIMQRPIPHTERENTLSGELFTVSPSPIGF